MQGQMNLLGAPSREEAWAPPEPPLFHWVWETPDSVASKLDLNLGSLVLS